MTERITLAVAGLITLTFSAFFSGTLLYLLYPHIHILFPNLATQGVIAKELGWWDSVCLTWILSIVFKQVIPISNK